ncbi:hypothetical protein GGR32_002206 [Mesonia hippocampi]|uniref:Uncharacterized protein n=1 Tax=Mesonia hippocampi TaxID=1628250 RepID=A0A840ES75_9FLAO|nr:hypothetical protein [Mesonia hippocampi]MBB4119895.1 hypothetical protein [Mesonia hippocampi]
MNLLIGLPMLLLGLFIAVMVYINIKIKKKMSFIWGGYTLFSFSVILILFGILIIKNGI